MMHFLLILGDWPADPMLTGARFLTYMLMYASSDALEEIGKRLEKLYLKIIQRDSFQVQGDWEKATARTATNNPGAKQIVVKPGMKGLPLAHHIAPLASNNLEDATLTHARIHLVWAHVMMLFTLKVKQAREVLSGGLNVIGYSSDGITVGGKHIEQVRLRSDWFLKGAMCTLPLPPLEIEAWSSSDMQKVISEVAGDKAQKETEEMLRAAIEQAAIRKRVSYIISVSSLGIKRALRIMMDRGPGNRKVWIFLMSLGFPIHLDWDPHHVSSGELEHLFKVAKPPGFERLSKVRSTADGVHSLKITGFMQKFIDLPDDDILELAQEAEPEVRVSYGAHGTDAELAQRLRQAAKEIRSAISTFTSENRFAKDIYAAEHIVPNWDLWHLAVSCILRKERPGFHSISARRVIAKNVEKHGARADYIGIQFAPHQMDLMLRTLTLDEYHNGTQDDDAPYAYAGIDKEQEAEDQRVLTTAKRNALNLPLPSADKHDAEDELNQDGTKTANIGKNDDQGPCINTKRQARVADMKKRVEEAARPEPPVPTESAVDMSLLGVLYQLFSVDESKLRCILLLKYGKPMLWFHCMGIMQTWRNLMARVSFYAEHPSMMSEVAYVFRKPISTRELLIDERLKAENFLARTVGRIVDGVYSISMQTARLRMCMWNRIFLYAKNTSLDLTPEELATVCQDSDLTKKFSWVLRNPKTFVSPEESTPLSFATRPSVYQTKLDVDPVDRESADPTQATFAEGFTTFDSSVPQVSAFEFEKTLITRIRKLETDRHELAAEIVGYLMGVQNFHCVKEFYNYVGRDSDPSTAVAFVTEWQAPAALSTRDIEAKGADLSKKGRKAHHAGYHTGQQAWHLRECLVPTWIPFLRASTEGIRKPRNVGTKESFSVFDGREDFRKYGASSAQELLDLAFPDGGEFEANTIGFSSVNDVQDFLGQYQSTLMQHDAFSAALRYLADCPKVKVEEAADEIKKLLSVAPEHHDFNKEQQQQLKDFSFPIDQIPWILVAEFLIYEKFSFFHAATAENDRRWKYGRVHAIWMDGLLSQCKSCKAPLVLTITPRKNPDMKRCIWILEVLVRLRVALGIELDLATLEDWEKLSVPAESDPVPMDVDGEGDAADNATTGNLGGGQQPAGSAFGTDKKEAVR
ncbi:unnamed protein product [Amoebophrya sp. A25]|nr:unnamed protein product [Amoebophrya sp. A25]|eukprot:GSA25T00020313001.1